MRFEMEKKKSGTLLHENRKMRTLKEELQNQLEELTRMLEEKDKELDDQDAQIK